MIGLQKLHVHLFAVIIEDHQILVDGWPDNRGRKRVLREVEFSQGANIGVGSVREIAIHGVGLNCFAKIVEPVFERGHTERLSTLGSGSQNIQQEPEAGNERDGRERQNCKFIARQADQFNTTGSLEGARREC